MILYNIMELENNFPLDKINVLRNQITSSNYKQKVNPNEMWGGADVLIRKEMNAELSQWQGNENIVISFQNFTPHRQVVVTEYAAELTWLFYQLGQIFSDQIDFSSKYDFYGFLAYSSRKYIQQNPSNGSCEQLLLSVLSALENQQK